MKIHAADVRIAVFLALALAANLTPAIAQEQSLPPAVRTVFSTQPFRSQFRAVFRLNPFFLQGDFDGDGRLDTAVFVQDRINGNHGIAVVLAATGKPEVLGGGKSFGNGGDDFSWLDAWHTVPKGDVAKGAEGSTPPKLRGDAIWVEKTEAASAIVYWDGSAFQWSQQGD